MVRSGSYRIVIPTRDGGKWLAPFARAYQRLGLRPLYLLDSRTTDNSREIIAQYGCDIVEITPVHNRGEDVLWRGVAAAGIDAEWLLRVDDDEMPSRALIEWIEQAGIHRPEPVFYLSGRQAWHGGYSRLEGFYFNHSRPDFLLPQPRLFRPAGITYTDALHTPGIVVPPDAGWAPDSAFYMHADWLVRSLQARLAKLKGYEAQRAGGGRDFAHFSLPEFQEPERLRITAFETEEFVPLLAEIAALNGVMGTEV
jgi:hypothetical protein